MKRGGLIIALLVLAVLLSLLWSVTEGSSALSYAQVLRGLHEQTGMLHNILWQLRVPRAIAAFGAGGLLALAGCLMQVLLHNPLADPYVLGISGGAALMLLIVSSLGVSGDLALTGATLLGASLALALVVFLSRAWRCAAQSLLLTGVVLACAFGTLMSLVLIVSRAQTAQAFLYWLLGDLSNPRLPFCSLAVLLVLACYASYLAPQLDLLRYGVREARALGVNVKRLVCQLLLLTSLATALAVNMAGSIGFVGLVVPHMLRLLHPGGIVI